MILAGAQADQAVLARFQTEAEAVARLAHPNIVQVYDIGQVNGCPYFTLEYVDGGSLANLIDGTPWEPHRAAEVIETLARAMHHAHERGIVHRDLKPANVLRTADGILKITDFGLAKLVASDDLVKTQTGVIMGTP